MKNLMHDVRQFHITFDHPFSDKPTLQPNDRASARADWLIEEANELIDAKTITEQADAYIDSIYFAVGGLVELGIDPQPLWDIVHGANMAKVQSDGSVKRRDDGKIVKPANWIDPAPLLEAEVHRQIGISDEPR